jgi:hypothetical protein
MTIAACYLSAEGIVFGADSTSTVFVPGPSSQPAGADRHFDFGQKIFEIGEAATLGIATWGLGGLPAKSYRTMVAELADDLARQPAASVEEVATRWGEQFWNEYSTRLSGVLHRTQALQQNPSRTAEEDNELKELRQTFSGGFCIGGYQLPDRTPRAFEVSYKADMATIGPPVPQKLGSSKFWGCPSLIQRLIYGSDFAFIEDVLNSGKWSGSRDDMHDLQSLHVLGQPIDLPIREAIDWVHASVSATIKMTKFSHLSRVCGGTVELAVVTTDRPFRWVRHKPLDAAIEATGS